MQTAVLEYILTGVCVTLLTGVSTIGNICVLAVFVRTEQLRTVYSYFIVSLTVGNLLAGFGYPLQCLVNLGVVAQMPVCLAGACCLLVVAQIMIWSLLALTVERYIAITRPLTAGNIITETRVFKIIAAIFILALVSGGVVPVLLSTTRDSSDTDDPSQTCRFSNLVPNSGYRLFLMICRVVSVIVFFLVYAKILLVVRRHMRAIDSQTTQGTTGVSAPVAETEQASTSGEEVVLRTSVETRKPWARKVRSAAILFAIVTYHALSWIPLTIINIRSSETQGFVMLTLIHFLTYSSAAMNPVLYGLGNREVRSALVKLLSPNRRRNTMATN